MFPQTAKAIYIWVPSTTWRFYFWQLRPVWFLLCEEISFRERCIYCLHLGKILLLLFFQSLSSVQLFNPMDYSMPGSLSSTISQILLRFMPLSWWWYLTISSSVAPFSSCPQSFPSSGSFPVSQLFASGGQSIWASASASVLPISVDFL